MLKFSGFLLFFMLVYSQQHKLFTFDSLKRMQHKGLISLDEYFLKISESVYQNHAIIKCLTPLNLEFKRAKNKLEARTIQLFEARVLQRNESLRKKKLDSLIYMSPANHFKIHYYVEGSDAVDITDVNGNTIPDYIEKTGLYLDSVYQFEVIQSGFPDPLSLNNPFSIYIESMSGVYGYFDYDSELVIYLDSKYNWVPNNTDPEGKIIGALKVTIAHEFKHAIQYLHTPRLFEDLSENSYWLELDATRAEEWVYTEVNDYYNYLNNANSHLQIASITMRTTNDQGYNDCIWFIAMDEFFDPSFNLDLWNYYANNTSGVFQSISTQIQAKGSTFYQVAADYLSWLYFTGNRATLDYGFLESESYRQTTMHRSLTQSDVFSTFSGQVAPLAVHLNQLQLSDSLYLKVNAVIDNNLQIRLLCKTQSDSTFMLISDFNQNTLQFTLPKRANAYKQIAIAVLNPNYIGANLNYSFSFTLEELDESLLLIPNSFISEKQYDQSFLIRFSTEKEMNVKQIVLQRSISDKVLSELVDSDFTDIAVFDSFNSYPNGRNNLSYRDYPHTIDQNLYYRIVYKNFTDSVISNLVGNLITVDNQLRLLNEITKPISYPNPFKTSLEIKIAVPLPNNYHFYIFDINGRLIFHEQKLLIPENNDQNLWQWNGKNNLGMDCASGIYFFKIADPNSQRSASAKLIKIN